MHQIKGDEWFEKDITKVSGKDLPLAQRLYRCGGAGLQSKLPESLFGLEAFPAKIFLLQKATDKDYTEAEVDCFLKLFDCCKNGTLTIDPAFVSLKMLRESYHLMTQQILELYYTNWPHWGMVPHMHFLTPRTSVCHKTESVCTLSVILQAEVLEKYFLSKEKTQQLGPPANPICGKPILSKLLEDHKEVECTQQKDSPQLSLCSGKKVAAHGALLQSKSTDRRSGGLGAKTGLFLVDLCKNNPQITENARCLQARYNKGISSRDGEVSGVLKVKACATPDRLNKRQNGRRFKNEEEEMFTITATDIHGILQGSRIRRLTPLETFRLQGVPDEYFYRAAAMCSDSQLYKQAGNAVTVPVVRAIGERLMEIIKSEEGTL